MRIEKIEGLIKKIADKNSKQAKELEKILVKYYYAGDELKADAYDELHSYLYKMFTRLLTRKCAVELSDLSCAVIEECYLLEKNSNDGWYVGTKAATRRVLDDKGNVVEQGRIPRKYKVGYYLDPKPAATRNDVLGNIAANNFYYKYTDRLSIISDLMDARMDFVSNDLEFKDPNIDMSFVEDLLDCLEIPRLPKKDDQLKLK